MSNKENNILVVGTGTIGEPLIGLLAQHQKSFGVDNVYFFKRTPLSDERGKVEALIRKGSKLVSTNDVLDKFNNLGFEAEDVEKAYEKCSVIIDCTPSGNSNWENIYSKLDSNKGSWLRDQNMDLVLFLHGVLIIKL